MFQSKGVNHGLWQTAQETDGQRRQEAEEEVIQWIMAARKNKIQHDDKTKRLIQASQLLNRLIAHANGECEMTASQVNAAKIVIGKAIPDLKAVEISGDQDKPLQTVNRIVREIIDSPKN